jgi:hypothetical protein
MAEVDDVIDDDGDSERGADSVWFDDMDPRIVRVANDVRDADGDGDSVGNARIEGDEDADTLSVPVSDIFADADGDRVAIAVGDVVEESVTTKLAIAVFESVTVGGALVRGVLDCVCIRDCLAEDVVELSIVDETNDDNDADIVLGPGAVGAADRVSEGKGETDALKE